MQDPEVLSIAYYKFIVEEPVAALQIEAEPAANANGDEIDDITITLSGSVGRVLQVEKELCAEGVITLAISLPQDDTPREAIFFSVVFTEVESNTKGSPTDVQLSRDNVSSFIAGGAVTLNYLASCVEAVEFAFLPSSANRRTCAAHPLAPSSASSSSQLNQSAWNDVRKQATIQFTETGVLLFCYKDQNRYAPVALEETRDLEVPVLLPTDYTTALDGGLTWTSPYSSQSTAPSEELAARVASSGSTWENIDHFVEILVSEILQLEKLIDSSNWTAAPEVVLSTHVRYAGVLSFVHKLVAERADTDAGAFGFVDPGVFGLHIFLNAVLVASVPLQ